MLGATLGHYKILEALGEGGMGVVYKARDRKLERTVAIKVLAPEKAGDAERKQRFLLEARAASALNHPNIVVIHEIAEEGGIDYIVMEYVAGRTLDQVIPPKGLRPPEVLRYATQIAAALAAAHEEGITHRDLKPGNVMITDKGVVKVLDFGLAKFSEKKTLSSEDSTVQQRPLTEKGSIMGTVAYMSPEQAEGKAVDARSDIFSFGSMLYEMCTGAAPFRGETKMSTLSSILRDEPKTLRELNGDIPPELERVIHRCLKKNAARRFQSTADLQIALEELREESDSGRLTSPSAAVEGRRGKPWAKWAAITAGIALFGIGAVWIVGRKVPAPAGRETTLTQLTFDTGLTTEPSYWAQGNLIAYASDRATDGDNLDIWIQQLNGGETRRLTTDPADDRTPDIAPDGSRIVFRSERDGGGLFVVPTIGGQERKIASEGYDPKFSPDGKWIAYWTGDPVGTAQYFPNDALSRAWIMPAGGGAAKPASSEKGTVHPFWAPDSKHLVFGWFRRAGTDWYAIGLDGGEPKRTGMLEQIGKSRLEALATPMRWEGNAIYFNARTGDSGGTWRIPIDPVTFRATGEPSRVTLSSGLETYVNLAGETMVYANTLNNDDVYVLPMEVNEGKVTGELVRLTRNLAPEYGATISHDGKRVGYASLISGMYLISVRDLASGTDTRVASFEGRGTVPISISPEGTRMAWTEVVGRKPELHVGGLDGVSKVLPNAGAVRTWGGDPSRILISKQGASYLVDPDSGLETKVISFSPQGVQLSMDARFAVLYGLGKVQVAELSANRVATEKDLIDITDGKYNDILPEMSPNNRIVYFYSTRDGKQCLYAQRFDPEKKRREGDPFVIKHFHSARVTPAYVSAGRRRLDTARDKIVLTMAERTGNIWRVDMGK